MIDGVEWLRIFVLDYPSLQYLLIFLGVAFGGEIVLLGLSFLAAQNIVSLGALVVFSFLGTLFSDSLWFLLGRTKIVRKMISSTKIENTVSLIANAITRMSRGNHLLALILAKFMVGTRIVIILFISKTDLLFSHFIRYNLFAVLFWLLVVIPIGFMTGLGFIYLAEVFQNLYVGVGFLLLIVIVIIILKSWLKKKFLEGQNQ